MGTHGDAFVAFATEDRSGFIGRQAIDSNGFDETYEFSSTA